MKILRAEHLGMCFGVRDAIALALRTAQSAPVTVLGDLVHNEIVLGQLRERGIQIVPQPEAIQTKRVLITAHGASQSALTRVRGMGFDVAEATCPLVQVAHKAVRTLAQQGFYPVIIGVKGHVEVRGITEDLEQCDIVLKEEEVRQLAPRPRFGVVAQTTQPIDRVRRLVQFMRHCFPESEVRFMDTVCHPTKQRQASAVSLAQRCSVVIVIGGAHSNNTRELAQTCGEHCSRVHQVQTAADLQTDWFEAEDVVGITAGTSTPDSSIAEVENWLHEASEKMVSRSRVATW